MQNEWISVKDRLPDRKEHDWVLIVGVFNEGGFFVPHIAELRNGVWYVDCYDEPFEKFCGVKVTHWLPLPKLPKGE